MGRGDEEREQRKTQRSGHQALRHSTRIGTPMSGRGFRPWETSKRSVPRRWGVNSKSYVSPTLTTWRAGRGVRTDTGTSKPSLATRRQSTSAPPGAGRVAESGALSENTAAAGGTKDRKSTRLNSSHQIISYAVFCLKK